MDAAGERGVLGQEQRLRQRDAIEPPPAVVRPFREQKGQGLFEEGVQALFGERLRRDCGWWERRDARLRHLVLDKKSVTERLRVGAGGASTRTR